MMFNNFQHVQIRENKRQQCTVLYTQHAVVNVYQDKTVCSASWQPSESESALLFGNTSIVLTYVERDRLRPLLRVLDHLLVKLVKHAMAILFDRDIIGLMLLGFDELTQMKNVLLVMP